jgi:hypothetical protein
MMGIQILQNSFSRVLHKFTGLIASYLTYTEMLPRVYPFLNKYANIYFLNSLD